MRHACLLVIVCLFAWPTVEGQQALPTAAQCRVDQKYFSAEVERSVFQMATSPKAAAKAAAAGQLGVDRLSVEELRKRSIEMAACELADTESAIAYDEASGFFASFAEQREFDFLKRHHLVSEFYAEDAKGLR